MLITFKYHFLHFSKKKSGSATYVRYVCNSLIPVEKKYTYSKKKTKKKQLKAFFNIAKKYTKASHIHPSEQQRKKKNLSKLHYIVKHALYIFTDGIVAYSMPQGETRGNDWEFYDSIYDGLWDGELRRGLGQLIDGKAGPDNFKSGFHTHEKGKGWVGWKNDTRNGQPVEIKFEFDRVREFTAVHIVCSNQFTKDIKVSYLSLSIFFFFDIFIRKKNERLATEYIIETLIMSN